MVVLVGLAVQALAPPVAGAQSSQLNPQLFVPPTARGATFTIARPTIPRHLSYELGLAANVAADVLVRGGPNEADIVPWRGQADVMAALGLFEWIELGVAVPVVLQRVADDPLESNVTHTTVARPGNVRLSVKVPVYRGDRFRVAARTVAGLPSGDGGRLTGTGYWTLTPGVVGTYTVGRVTIAANLSYPLRRRAVIGDLEYDDEIYMSAGVSVDVVPQLDVIAESQLRIGVGGRSVGVNEVPAEADLGVRWTPVHGLSVDFGGGTGLVDGWGAPTGRAFAMVRWASQREPCEAGPEDYDGYLDGDFCADPDNDGDGIPDREDECPNDAEDEDGYLDGDGCPDLDNDGDGVLDGEDECPMQSEDRDGWRDLDGCRDEDNDGDGIPDGLDECPMEPEDADDYEDEDGCPEPGPEKATVTVTDTRILISERIYFDFDNATIRKVSKPLLDQVAKVIKDLPEERHIRVEGFTDSEGNDEYNQDLSYRRARSVVEYLAAKGVDRDRLSYKGYGEKHPVAPNDTPEGRALNRRVQFTILGPDESPEKAPPGGASSGGAPGAGDGG